MILEIPKKLINPGHHSRTNWQLMCEEFKTQSNTFLSSRITFQGGEGVRQVYISNHFHGVLFIYFAITHRRVQSESIRL